MGDHAWKKTERRIARYLGAERNPLSGGNARHSRSDSLHPKIFVETKHGKGVPKTWAAVRKLFAETAEKAAVEGKIPLVVIHEKFSAGVENYDAYLEIDRFVGYRRNTQRIFVCVPLRIARGILLGGKEK